MSKEDVATPRLIKMLRQHSGDPTYHPLSALLSLASDEKAGIGDKITIHKELAKYCEPQLRQIEYSGAKDKPPITMRIILEEDESE